MRWAIALDHIKCTRVLRQPVAVEKEETVSGSNEKKKIKKNLFIYFLGTTQNASTRRSRTAEADKKL